MILTHNFTRLSLVLSFALFTGTFSIFNHSADTKELYAPSLFSDNTSLSSEENYVLPAANGTDCGCKEYVYLNEPSSGKVHKYEIDISDGTLIEINPSGPWYPDGGTSEMASPHGLGTDVNGYLYISETIGGNIRKLDCQGNIFPTSDFEIATGSFNMGSIGNTLFTNNGSGSVVSAYDLCTESKIGDVTFAAATGRSGRIWGFYVDPRTDFMYCTFNDGAVYRFSESDVNGAAVPALIDDAGGRLHGITTDDKENLYIVDRDGGDNIKKFDSEGNLLLDGPVDNTEGDGGWFGSHGIIWSEESGDLYVSNYTAIDDCISRIDTSDLTYIGAAVGPSPTGNVAKAMSIIKECCPMSANVTIDTTLCGGTIGQDIFLQDILNCGDGIICEGSWTAGGLNSGMTYNSCNQTVTINSTQACGTFTFSSAGLGNNNLCGPFIVTLNIEVEVIEDNLVTGDQIICSSELPSVLTALATSSGTLGLQWQQSTTSCSDGFTDIPGAILPTYLPGLLTETTYFRMVATVNGSCSSGSCTEISNCTTITVNPCAAPCTPGGLGGRVFIDYNYNGEDDGMQEDGPAGIEVNLYKSDGSGGSILQETQFTDNEGDYTFVSGGITFGSGEEYRVEFGNLPGPYVYSTVGSSGYSNTQFISESSCDVSMGIVDPALYCQTDAKLVINCFADGPNDGNQDVLISVPYNATPSGSENNDLNLLAHESVAKDIGSTFGLAYQRESQTLFSSAYLKRFSGFGPEGPGAIYKIPDPFDGNLSGELFVDLNDLFGSDVAGADPHDFVTKTGGGDVIDEDAFNLVGRIAFGDMDISTDGTELYVVNLMDRSIYNIPLGSDPYNPIAPTNSSEVTVIPLADSGSPLPGIPIGVLNEEIIPFALKYYNEKLFVGLVTNGQASGPLFGLVYSYDFSTMTFSKELEFSLDYHRGCGFGSGSTCYGPAKWTNWLNNNVWPTPTVSGLGEMGYPQAMLTDIEFDNRGNMIIGLRDRWGDQGGLQAPQPNSPYTLRISDAFGDILFADYADGSWSVNLVNFIDPSTANGTSENVFGEDNYSAGGYYHEETALGGLAVHHGYNSVAMASMDPRVNAFSNGIDWFDLSDPNKGLEKAITVLTGGTSVFGKSYGLGEIEMLCELVPVEVGNYVWVDINENGIQDPGEPAIEDMTIKLYSKPSGGGNSNLVATTQSNANGEYYFSSSDNSNQTWEAGYDNIERDSSYFIVFCGDEYDETTGVVTIGPDAYTMTMNDIGEGDNTDQNDSDITQMTITGIGDFPVIMITANETNYDYDAGFLPKPDVALKLELDPGFDISTVTYGIPVKFLATAYNQSLLDLDSITIIDYIPAGFEFDADNPQNAIWTLNGGNAETKIYDLKGKTDQSVCIYLNLLTGSTPSDWTNVAEISDAMNNGLSVEDCDSKLDNNPDNNGGGELGSGADDYIDGDGTATEEDGVDSTDQDNADPATVPVFDLALDKKLLDDKAYAPGELAVFNITVYNQGNVDAVRYQITDYLREGFTFSATNNMGWSQVGDDLVYTSSSTLAAGGQIIVPLELMVVIPATTSITDWWNYAEISFADNDNDNNNPFIPDPDSVPDGNENNDNDVDPDDGQDDEINENWYTGGDQDDHDPAKVTVGYDLAMVKTTLTPAPYKYGDTITYRINILNQGGLTVSDISVYDSIPCGLVYHQSLNNSDWTFADNVAKTTIDETLPSGQNVFRDIKLVVQKCATPAYDNYINIAEIFDFKDEDGNEPSTDDIDSTPDEDPLDDDLVDDQLNDPDDEDDHDIENIDVCDLAIINKIVSAPSTLNIYDTIKYEVIVFNQGNGDAKAVNISYQIPDGFNYLGINDSSTTPWTSPSSNLAKAETSNTIAPGQSDTLCLYLQLDNVPTSSASTDSWTTTAEIFQYSDADDNIKTFDADSTPDEVTDNDSGGNPDDDTDNETDGDGTGNPDDDLEDSDPELDEDDHDAEILYVCDVATIIYEEEDGEHNYGDILKYYIEVHNQGNKNIKNVSLKNIIGEGLAYVNTTSNESAGWIANSESELSITIENEIEPGDIFDLCLELMIVPDHDSGTASWLQQIEVTSFEDPDNPGTNKNDIDSNPDGDIENDSGGNPDDDTDDTTDGDGNGDPDDDIEDMDPNLDEDDHDPVNTKVYDLALKMQIDSMPPVLPVVPGDVVKFNIIVFNQGNTEANQVKLVNYVMDENLFLNVQSKLDGWDETTSEKSKFTLSNPIAPGQSDTTCIYLQVISGAMSDIVTWAEIEGSVETDGDCYDIDSDPNDINGDDIGGDPGDITDNHIEDDGTDFNNDGVTDEDDHDPAMLSAQDLALIMWADQKEPVIPNQDVKFIIRLTNQGNITNHNIKIADYIPKGFELSDNDTNGWEEESESIVTKILDGPLAMNETLETCIVLKVLPGVNANDLVNYAEIVSSVDNEGESLDLRDIDSTPDMLKTNDPGGEPSDLIDCSVDPIIIGDDNRTDGAGINGEDEDDHDPAWVPVFDLATIIYTDHTEPIIPGDDIKFLVDVHNQGNMGAENILFTIYMPDGFSLSDINSEPWEDLGDGKLEIQTTDQLHPGDINQICLYLTVNDDFTLVDLIPFVEIGSTMDTLGNIRNDFDLDSDPDNISGNDLGGLPDSDSDDQLDGTGLLGDDEDDHDPVIPPVLDLAIKIVNSDDSSKVPGDIAKFIVTVYNQGSITPKSFVIENYVPEGLIFNESSDNSNWISNGTNAVYNYTESLQPFESDTICIYLEVAEGAHPKNVVDMVEITEVIDDQDINVSTRDIDSVSDSSNENDKGNDCYSAEDNKIFENGRSGDDEDDHDQAFVLLCQEMVCISHVNVSLDENCEINLTPAMFLEGDLFPDDFYEYYIHDHFGNPIEITSFDYDDIGNSYQLSIYAPICSNSCWLDVTVEYKLPPVIDCPDDMTLSCGALNVLGLPPVTGACAPFEVFLFNETRESLICDPLYTHIITRTYKAVDELGNESECSHTIYIERVDLGGIFFPENLSVSTGNPIECNDPLYEFDENGIPVPWPSDPMTGSGSGVPIQCDPMITNGLICPGTGMMTGVPLIPGENQQICSAVVLYTDLELPEISCVRKIMRTWEVREWWCNGENSVGGIQLIEIIDTEAPEFICPQDFTVSTNDNCAGSVDLPSISGQDDCDHGFEVRIEYPTGFIHGNGGLAELELGVNTIRYIVNDECYNTADCFINVTVEDSTEPVAICEPNTVVSISMNGNTIVAAEVFDDGSWDECELDRFEVRRMDTICVASDTIFGESISFCCSDVDQDVMVVFRAIDKSDNYNDCMVRVEVQDKVSPEITCPEDMTIDCREAYDLNNLGLTFGNPEVVDNCMNLEDVFEITTPDVNQCGIGEISRKFELRNADGYVLRTCKQHVVIINTSPFVESNIVWPLNYAVENLCGLNDLRPENLPVESAFPIYTSGDDECSLLGYDYEDIVLEPTPGTGECAHIERTWRVINWCSQIDGQFEIFEMPWPQLIELHNTIDPELIPLPDTVFESANIDCLSGDIEIVREATNDCANELIWYYELFDADSVLVGLGQNDSIVTELPVGFYSVNWRVEDGCGNFDIDTTYFEVRNTKSPSPVCIQGLSVNMEQWLEVELNVDQMDGGSFHTCNNSFTLSFSQDTSLHTIVFDCDDIGLQTVQLWVTDNVTGAQDYCSSFIDVQDNEDVCPANSNVVSVSGEVFTELSEMIEDVTVELGVPDIFKKTDEQGYYAFDNMPKGGAYQIIPKLDRDYLNGISTLDLILIQRHILGIEKLDSPYKLIAADVNNSSDISAIDLVELRKLILGVYSELPQNTSWRFVDEQYEFPELLNPWVEVFPESYGIGLLDQNMFIDFIGVKIGDVNDSAITNTLSDGNTSVDGRSQLLSFNVRNKKLRKGETFTVEVKGSNYNNISGWQGTMEFPQGQVDILEVNPVNLALTDDNLNMSGREDGWISMSYHSHAPETMNDKVLFEILLYAKDDVNVGDLFKWSSAITASEAYLSSGDIIGFTFNDTEIKNSRIISINPNPWINTTDIVFKLEKSGDVQFEYFDLSGKLLWREVQYFEKGIHQNEISSTEIQTTGLIYVKMISDGQVNETKMLKIK